MCSGTGEVGNLTKPPPCHTHTHLSYFSRGDLPFIGASKHTGDVPVEDRGGRTSVPLRSSASRAQAGWLCDTHPWPIINT